MATSRFGRMDIEGMPEEKRLAILDRLERTRSGLSNLAAGVLAGKATPDRPDVPIWDYLRFAATHPEISIDDLAQIRFPVVFFGVEEFTIESAADLLEPHPIPPRRPWTLETVIDMWTAIFAGGIVRWNSELRAVEMIQPMSEYKRVLREWDAARRD